MSGPWIVAVVALWVLLALVAFIVLGLVRRTTSILERLESQIRQPGMLVGGPPTGSSLPAFEAMDATGSAVRSSDLAGEPSIWLLMTSECEPCQRLASELRGRDGHLTGGRLVIATDDSPVALGVPPGIMVLQPLDDSISTVFGTAFTPYAFSTDARGIVRETMIPQTVEELELLASRLAHVTSIEPGVS